MNDLDIQSLIDDEAFDQAAKAISDDMSGEGGSRWKRALSAMGGRKVREAVAAKLKQYDVIEAFAKGWAGTDEMQKAAKSGENTGEATFYRLGKFSQNLDLLPIITISAAGIKSPPIQLVISLDGEFEAVEVAVKERHITEIGGGRLKLGASLQYGAFSFLAGKLPRVYELPLGKKFTDPGLKIAPQKSE